jgi:GTP:adenosylcobinamide-phosphate guanylyltransferase
MGLAGGQLVQPGVEGVRQGYKGEKPVAGSFDEFSDAVLNSYAKDDITFIKDYKYSNNITRSKTNSRGYLDKLVEKTGLDEDTILNLFEDRESLYELEGRKGGAPPRESKFYKQAENWITKNSSRYADPDKFKKAFVRVFGKNNDLIKTINKLAKDATGRKRTSVPFSNWFKETILGTTEGVKAGYNSSQLNSIFKTAVYTNNPNVRKNITKEIKRLLSMPMAKGGKFDIRDAIKSSKIFKQFGFDKQIRGPIARLLANEITKSVIIPGSGEKVLKQISAFRDPYLPTEQLIKYLSDRVDSKYKSMFDETAKAVSHAVKQKWPEAKKALNIADNIMFDHSIPKELVKLGYADEIEYIKLKPTSKEFNTRIKNPQFDQKIIKLAHQWKAATTVDAKAKIVGEMNILKDKFSKKYGNYLEDVKITPDKTGKPIFSSTADVVTKKTDLVKSLETSLQQEKFPTMSESKQAKLLQKLGYGRHCKASGGRVGFQDAGDVGAGQMKCIMDDVKKTKADMKSSSVEVRAMAKTKLTNGFKIASKMPQLAKILKTGVQLGTAAITKPLQALGLTSGIGYAIEGLVEGYFYDAARRKGYSHEQAMAETLTPGLIAGRPHDVPWYGGSEKLREKELYTQTDPREFVYFDGKEFKNPNFEKPTGKIDSKVLHYVDALEEEGRIDKAIRAKEEAKADLELAETGFGATLLPGDLGAASADVQDLARSGAYRRVDKTLNPESMASQAYNTAVESQQALDQRRRKEYLEKVEPAFLEREQKSFDTKRHREKRYEEMDKMYPVTDFSDELIDKLLKQSNMYINPKFRSEGRTVENPQGLEFLQGFTYDDVRKFYKAEEKRELDKQKQSYFARNFKMEKAEGGIASLKKW